MTTLDFELPPELEARLPAELRGDGRDDVRLLVTRKRDDSVVHAHFRELPRFLDPGDLVVLNTTATLPAAVTAVRGNGDVIALHFSTALPDGRVIVEPRWSRGSAQATPRPSIHRSERLPYVYGDARITFLEPYRDSVRLWLARFESDVPLRTYLQRHGHPIAYSYIDQRFPIDAYQTVFARDAGSAEMPSAGRAFTRQMLVCLRRRGVRLARLVLHAGVASLEEHERPHEEFFDVPQRTADEVRRAKARGGRIVAVGTTVVRALESSVGDDDEVVATRGWTDVVITPERGVRVVDALLTGFHEPRATHLAMLEAIAGRDHIAKGYAAALGHGYLWHEFGDLHLIV
ncbi:MAG TPA: S-adenosylmethionine:tRNA ribosyltransferase-isomerase [Thermoanaerobaculia bacterium]|jgi:S-adenosylmethionine:tRNA ribosyltransferase-isomerase